MNQRGYTFLELLIALSLISVVFSLVFTVLFSGLAQYKKGQGKAEEHQQIRMVFSMIDTQIRRSGSLRGKVTCRRDVTVSGSSLFILTVGNAKFTFDEREKVIRFTQNSGTNQLAYNIEGFEADLDPDTQLLHIWAKARTSEESTGFELSTCYFIRE